MGRIASVTGTAVMEGFEGFDLEVDSVTDLQVPVVDVDESLGAEVVDEQHTLRSVVGSGARSLHGAEGSRLPVNPGAGQSLTS